MVFEFHSSACINVSIHELSFMTIVQDSRGLVTALLKSFSYKKIVYCRC